jgi:hypothetical protein
VFHAIDMTHPNRILALALLLSAGTIPALGQIAVRNQGFVPFSDPPINYRTDPVDDPVARLQARLASREATLTYEPGRGYLRSVLQHLHVPVSSQSLVFSKTSFQFRLISPATPRAVYFNDDVYIGFVNGGKALEVIAFDARQGAIFYILDQQPPPAGAPAPVPVFQRAELDCTQCHVAAATRGVPGVFLRSIHALPTGTQASQAPSFITGHQSPLKERFGGWYVTGTHGRQTHMGNVVVRDREHPAQLDREAGANVVDLKSRLDTALDFDASPYLSKHSDIVAQLVQAHQTQMHNLITLTNYKTRLALHAGNGAIATDARRQFEEPAEELLESLLFVDEAPLDEPVAGTSGFAEEFSARGLRDPQGRSLRDFDLRTRLFKYPCSYLIYSESFDALPEPAKSYVYQRLLDILTGRDHNEAFARLTATDRRAVFEILLATKPGLPEAWRSHATESSRGPRTTGGGH